MMANLIEVRGVTRSYQRGSETLRVLDGLDFEMPGGSFHALMGPSGSGKTTLLNLIGGLDQADTGSVTVAGEDLAGLSPSELAHWRSQTVGFVFQGFNLIPVLTALENLELALLLTPLSKRDRRDHATHALELVGLADRVHHKPAELSGGEEQRVAIARAIVTDPKLILADEPTGDLDRAATEQVLEIMEKLNRELGKTVLMVTHDPVAAQHSDRLIHLDKGRLGSAEQTRPVPAGSAEG